MGRISRNRFPSLCILPELQCGLRKSQKAEIVGIALCLNCSIDLRKSQKAEILDIALCLNCNVGLRKSQKAGIWGIALWSKCIVPKTGF